MISQTVLEFDAPKEFEIALFSSHYVKKMELRF